MIQESKEVYYMYRHVRLDKNEVFYIGIGRKLKKIDNVLHDHTIYSRAFTDDSRNNIWRSITNKTDYRVDILFESDDRNIIIEKEIEFISLYGRIDLRTGSLANMTSGGEGVAGRSEELRKSMRDKMTGRKVSEESKEKMSKIKQKENNPMFNRKHSEETRKKISEGIKRNPGKPHAQSPETIEKIRQSRMGSKHWLSIKVINTETGEIFDTITAAAASKNFSRWVLSGMLKNQVLNTTPFVKLSEYDSKK